MKKIVAFAGKGGVGKTTCCVLFLKYVLEETDISDILVIDADPDANIADAIGKEVHFRDTLGGKMREFRKQLERNELSPRMNKKQVIEGEVFSCLIERERFDLIEMGRTEGEGCYCFINNVLKNAIDVISENYDLTIVDTPAGLEHFARKTGRDVSDLVVVVDPSKMAIHTLERIVEVSDEVSLNFEKIWVIGNRYSPAIQDLLVQKIEAVKNKTIDKHLHLLGFLPESTEISSFNLRGKNLLDLPSDNRTFQAARELFGKIL